MSSISDSKRLTSSDSSGSSDLVELSPDGTVKTVVRLDGHVYKMGASSFHANAVRYDAADDSYTVGDAYAAFIVKLTRIAPRFAIGAGLAIQAIGGYWMTQFDINLTDSEVFWSNFLMGLGQSVAFTPMTIDSEVAAVAAADSTLLQSFMVWPAPGRSPM